MKHWRVERGSRHWALREGILLVGGADREGGVGDVADLLDAGERLGQVAAGDVGGVAVGSGDDLDARAAQAVGDVVLDASDDQNVDAQLEEQLDELLERQRGVGHVLAFGDDPARDGVAHEAGGAGEIRRYFQSIAGYGDPHLNLLFVKQHLPYR